MDFILSTWLSERWFHLTAGPVLFAGIGILANRLGKRAGDDSPEINDFAVGTNVMLMDIGTVFADMRNLNDIQALFEGLGWIIGMLFAFMVLVDNDRYGAWKRDQRGKPTKEKRFWRGVFFPNVVALLIFIAYRYNKD